MHSERNLMFKGLLQLFTASKYVLAVSDIIASFNGIRTDKQYSFDLHVALCW